MKRLTIEAVLTVDGDTLYADGMSLAYILRAAMPTTDYGNGTPVRFDWPVRITVERERDD